MSVDTSNPPTSPPYSLPTPAADFNVTTATPGAERVPVSALDQRREEHKLFADAWDNLDVLRQGGRVLQMQADRFLIKRPKEPNDVYQVRLQHLKYQNLLAMILGYYCAKLFESDPDVDIKIAGEAIEEPADPEAPDLSDPDEDAWDFYQETFLKDCDRAGTDFVDFMRAVIEDVLLFQRSYILIDLPRGVQNGATLADQDVRPLLRRYDPRQCINWEADQYGNLAWIVFEVQSFARKFMGPRVAIKTWYYFNTTEFFTYEWRADDQQTGTTQMARLVDSGPHSMSDYQNPETDQLGRVPVHVINVPADQWMANRVYFSLIDHFNTDNTYAWSLLMANLAIPVVITEGEYQPTLSEGGYILLPPGSEFKWTEPNGNTFKASETRLASLREEIFRMVNLQAQGRSSSASASSQSGYSKEQDMAPARDVLNYFGDMIRSNMQILLYLVAAIRQEPTIDFDVRGFDFAETDKLLDIEEAAAVEGLQIQSETFRKERQKHVVRSFAHDWNPELVAKIEGEIDSAPTQEELDQMQAQQDQQAIQTSLQRSAGKLLTKNETQE